TGTGALLGTGAALGALAVALGPASIATTGAAAWTVPIAATASAVLIVAGAALRSARRQTVRDPGDASGRARRLAGPGVVVLVSAAAALAVWQLQLYGSPLTPTADGGTDVDPVAVVAPALTLVAVVLIALTLFPRVAALTEVATRRAGTARILAARTVARRLQLVAAPLAVVAVACSTLMLAAAYSATWSDSFQRTTALRAGAPLQVSTGYTGLSADVVSRLRSVPGVAGVAAVDVETLQIGGDTGTILAVTPATVARVATTASGALDRDAIAAALATDLPGPDLPDGVGTLALETAQAGFGEAPALSLQVMDGDGVLHEVPAGAPEIRGADSTYSTDAVAFARVAYTMPIPDELASAPSPWHLMTVDARVAQAAVTGDGTARFVLTGLRADGTPLELDRFWLPESPILQFDSPVPDFAGLGFRIDANVLSIRMTPTFDQQLTDLSSPPVVISQQLADRYRLAIGDPVSFVLDDAYDRTTGQVALIIPAVPGADLETALMLDLGYVLHHRLRVEPTPDLPTVLWVDTADPEAAAAAFRHQLPANTRMHSAGDPAGRTVLGSAATALWLGAAGCLVLAMITVIAVARAQLRSRRVDVVVLRAIGFGSRDQAAVRRRELGLVLGFGAVAGLIAGAAVSLLTVPQLARAAVVEPYASVPTPLVVDLAGLAAGLGLLLLGLAAIVMVYASRVAQHARTAIGAEEVL
ncbi:MAG TPA: FtsX-like permease family protein, partial [Pseudolysinimonas sp.]|nr:FtsX-like permease family protein [Pseudolysinimonas sp.]